MTTKKTSNMGHVLLWFGAAVSIAEILTGALLAPLGFSKAMLAIILGHLIGCALLYAAGLIGAKTGLPAMESGRIAFGTHGSFFFSILNVLQLVGWTAVMIIGGAKAAAVVAGRFSSLGSTYLWCAVIGILIIIWILVGIKNLSKVNIFAVGALLILSVATGFVVFRGGSAPVLSDTLSFGAALELAIAMPLSWLPLIADYTSSARRPHLATGVSVGAYFVGSCLMYVIGLGAALFSGTSDIAEILVAAGLPVIAMIIVIFSTVTTTFLDVHSAGVSLKNVFSGISAKWTAIVVCVIGTLIAMFTPIEQYQDFLYLIGSVFAPMIAILISEYFILRSREVRSGVNIQNMILWLVGFIIYRVFMRVDIVIGSTIPVMIIVCVLCVIVSKVRKGFEKSGNQNA